MYYVLLPVIINLFYAAVQCQLEQYLEINLVNRLNDYYCFDHNIFLLDRALDPDRYVAASPSGSHRGKFTPQSVYTFTGDDDVGSRNNYTEMNYVKNVTIGKNPLLIVAVANLNFGNDSKILAEVKRIRNMQIISNLKIGIFVARNVVTSTDHIERLFRWSWSVGIVNIFGAFYSNIEDAASAFNVLRYDPFVAFELVNVTESQSFQNYFSDKIRNYRQHPLRFVKIDTLDLYAVEIEFWSTVARAFNASESTNYVNYKDKVWISPEADILLHDMTLTRIPSLSGNVRLHPNRMISLVLLVPHAGPYSDFVAYLQNSTWKLLFAYTFAVIVAATLLLAVSGYLHSKKILLVQCVVDVVNLLMNDNVAIPYGRLHSADVWIIVPLTFTGLIVVNGVVSVFQSFLTVPIYERQMNTFEDLFASNVPILVDEIGWVNRTVKALENLSKPGVWSDKVYPRNKTQIMEEIYKLNSSISVALPSHEMAHMVLEMQKRLNLEAFHLMTESLEKTLIGFQVGRYFPFAESINDLILRSHCFGLMDKWLKDHFQSEIKRIWKMSLNRQDKSDNESHSGEFTVPTVVWVGWVGSAIVFVGEIIWNKVRPKLKPHIEKIK